MGNTTFEKSHTNVESQENKSSSLIEREEIKGTPFVAIRTDEGWFITAGRHRLTEPVEKKEEAIRKVKLKEWDFMLSVIAMITKETIRIDNEN